MVNPKLSNVFLYTIAITLISSIAVYAQIEQGKGTIKGKILPLDSNATIYVTLPRDVIVGFATINSSGEYSITLPVGIYDIFIVPKVDYNNKSLFQIGVGENQVTEIPDIKLSKKGETGSISGYVNPIVDSIVVRIKKFGSEEFSGSSTIDSSGKYEITGLEPDTYGIFVNFNPTQNFYNYKWGMIDIVANVSLDGINITFTPKTSDYLIDRIFISFQPSVSEEEKRNIIGSYGSKIMQHYSYSRNYVVSVPSGKTAENMIDLLKENPEIKSASLYTFAHTSGSEQIEENGTNEKQNETVSGPNQTSSYIGPKAKDSGNESISDISQQKQIEYKKDKNPSTFFIIFFIIILSTYFLFLKLKKAKS